MAHPIAAMVEHEAPAKRELAAALRAADPLIARITFRNSDYPQRRQIFGGVRLAQDV
jgi:hypothetical protein